MQIPFISQLSNTESQQWLTLLNKAFYHQGLSCEVIASERYTDDKRERCTFAIVANPSAEDLIRYPNLIWMQSLWAGVEVIIEQLVKLPNHQNVPKVIRLIDPTLAQTMAEAVVTWSFYVLRDIANYHKQQQEKIWLQRPVRLASDTNVAILGLGKLGKLSARYLTNNHFNVFGWSRRKKSIDDIKCFSGSDGLVKMISQADIIVCLLPLTKETRYLINQTLIDSMKLGASIINFARGAIIDNKALLTALDSGQLNHAVLDVFEQEPLSEKSCLWQHSKVTILPHISAPTNKATAVNIVTSNIKRFIDTGVIPAAVDLTLGY